jgi:hypothetical protein
MKNKVYTQHQVCRDADEIPCSRRLRYVLLVNRDVPRVMESAVEVLDVVIIMVDMTSIGC